MPELSTFGAADWAPLLSASDGGPVVTDRVDRKVELNGYDTGWAEGDSVVAAATADHLRGDRADAVFAYLGNPDETSHRMGSIGREYRDAIALADRHVGMLVDAIRGRSTYAAEDWLILVSTDHGRRPDGGHGGDSEVERTIFYLAAGPSTVRGALPGTPQIVDVAVTALAHLGIWLDPAWGLDGAVVGLEP